jgi:hypothetical protein
VKNPEIIQIGFRAFPGKVDTGFPIGNATNIESRALSGHDPCNFRVNLIGKRSRAGFQFIAPNFTMLGCF